MSKTEDKKAILARRDAFIKKMLSESESKAVKGGAPVDVCLTCNVCLTVVPCYTPPCYTPPCYVVPAP